MSKAFQTEAENTTQQDCDFANLNRIGEREQGIGKDTNKFESEQRKGIKRVNQRGSVPIFVFDVCLLDLWSLSFNFENIISKMKRGEGDEAGGIIFFEKVKKKELRHGGHPANHRVGAAPATASTFFSGGLYFVVREKKDFVVLREERL